MNMARMIAAGVTCLAVAAPAVAQAPPAPPTRVPGEITVALSLPSPGLQAGAVSGTSVVLAKGLEPDLARDIARRIGVPRVRFVNEPTFSRLVAKGPKTWDMAIAAVSILPERRPNVDFSVPYLNADQGVLVRRGLSPAPATAADLADLTLCTEKGTSGAQVITRVIKPTRSPLRVDNPTRMFQLLQSARCDAIVYDSPILGAELASAPDRYGALVGRIRTGEQYGVVFPEASRLRPAVNRAIAAARAAGTLRTLTRTWLTTDVGSLRVLG